MQLENIPLPIYGIAASFENTAFIPSRLVLLDSNNYQLNATLKSERDVMIIIRFFPTGEIKYCFHETYAGNCTELLDWDCTEQAILEFWSWYQEASIDGENQA